MAENDDSGTHEPMSTELPIQEDGNQTGGNQTGGNQTGDNQTDGGGDKGGNKSQRAIVALGIYLTTLSLVLLVLIWFLWPSPGQLEKAECDKADQPRNESPVGAPTATDGSAEGSSALPPGPPTTPSGAAAAPSSTVPTGQSLAASSSEGASSPSQYAATNPEPKEPKSLEEEEEEKPNRILLLVLLVRSLPTDQRILLLVMVVGMLGSVIGAATSFTGYVGNRTFEGSWVWWFILRPFLGCMLALLLYFVAQAGFLTTPAEAVDQVANGRKDALENLFYTTLALAGLAGMFSKVTADKLESIFKNIMQSDADDKRRDKMENGQGDAG